MVDKQAQAEKRPPAEVPSGGFVAASYFFIMEINSAGKKTRLVSVASTSVREVSQPSDCVPPKPLKQKITKPAMSTSDVYRMLMPVL